MTNTFAYYYYNDTINITLVVNLTESNMNVSADMSSIGGGVVYNNSGVNVGGSIYEHTLRYNASTAPVIISQIYPNVVNKSTGVNTTSLLPFVAIMNIKPTTIDSTLGGNTTDWAAISDFTNVTGLIFEKFSGGNRIGRLEFNSSAAQAMNLTDPTTATALQSLSTNLNISVTSMDLNSSVGALAALNRSATLSAYNLTFFDNSPGILLDGSPIVVPGGSSGGGVVSGLAWSGSTLSFNVTHWSNYSWDGEKPVPHDISSNDTNINASVKLSVNWTDYNGSLKNFTFSTNVSGSWTNNSTTTLTGTQDWSNWTITLPSTPNTVVGWKVYAYDAVGNMNLTANQTITTTDSQAPTITITTPANATWVKNGSIILLNATITDNGAVTNATVNFSNFNISLPVAVNLTNTIDNYWAN
ncbi:MAG: hypothetical protein KAH86_08805, partial [Methanosarcinales archaeon]|nr:hypothetical protein [Methanosarcinales archaeon]